MALVEGQDQLDVDPSVAANLIAKRVFSLAQHRNRSKPVVDELRAYGFDVEYIEDLFNKRFHYEIAIPILLRWLPRAEDLGVKEAVVRALTVKWARPTATPALLKEYRETAHGGVGVHSLKWAIGNALEVLATEQDLDDLVEFATDKAHGRSRQMIVLALGKMWDPGAVDVLIGLLDDPDVTGHAVSALRRIAPARARESIEPFTTHPMTWIRNEAKRAIAKIDKAEEQTRARGQTGQRHP